MSQNVGRFQFSLRTLFIATTLTAIALHLYVLMLENTMFFVFAIATIPTFVLTITILGSLYLEHEYRAFCCGDDPVR